MSSSPPQPPTLLFHLPLGPVSRFDRFLFPLSYKKGLHRSECYLDATLAEVLKFRNIAATDPEKLRKFIHTTKARYDQLISKQAELKERPKTWKLSKIFADYRALLLFVASSKSLLRQTKSRSDELVRTLCRDMLESVPGGDIQPMEDDPSPDMDVVAIAVRLDRPLDDAATQELINAAESTACFSSTFGSDEAASEVSSVLSQEYYLASESLISLSIDAEEETPDVPTSPNPSSSATSTSKNYYGCIFSENSTIVQIGGTTQFGGHGNSGSVNHDVKTTSDMPNPLV